MLTLVLHTKVSTTPNFNAVLTDTIVLLSTDALISINRGFTAVTHFNQPVRIMVWYGELGAANESSLRLYWLNGLTWVTTGVNSSVVSTAKQVVALTDHFTDFAVFGKATQRVYLPVIVK